MGRTLDYQAMKDRCARRAAFSFSHQTKQAWPNLAESYEALLLLERIEHECVEIGTRS